MVDYVDYSGKLLRLPTFSDPACSGSSETAVFLEQRVGTPVGYTRQYYGQNVYASGVGNQNIAREVPTIEGIIGLDAAIQTAIAMVGPARSAVASLALSLKQQATLIYQAGGGYGDLPHNMAQYLEVLPGIDVIEREDITEVTTPGAPNLYDASTNSAYYSDYASISVNSIIVWKIIITSY